MAISVGFLFCWSFLLFQEAQIPVAKVNVKNTLKDIKPGIFRAIFCCLIWMKDRNNSVMVIFFDWVHNLKKMEKKSEILVPPCKEAAKYQFAVLCKERWSTKQSHEPKSLQNWIQSLCLWRTTGNFSVFPLLQEISIFFLWGAEDKRVGISIDKSSGALMWGVILTSFEGGQMLHFVWYATVWN